MKFFYENLCICCLATELLNLVHLTAVIPKLKYNFSKLDDSGNCIIRKNMLHCILFEKKYELNEVIPYDTRGVYCRLGQKHFNNMLMNILR